MLLRLLITDKQNANNYSSLPISPEKSTSSNTININHTLPSSSNIIDFCIDNDLIKEFISEVNKVKKVSLTTDNNEIKDNKTVKQTIYANNDSSHITATKTKNSNSNNNNNNANGNNNNDNIQDTITPNPSPNPSENQPGKGNDLNCGELHDGRIEIG